MNQPNKERFKTSVGGQALMEGIMMRGPKNICCAVRKPDGTIETKVEPTPTHGVWTKIPLVRGAISMIESLIMGYKYMMYSAQVSMGDDYDPAEEETAFEKWVGDHLGKKAEDILMAGAALVGGLFAILLFGGLFGFVGLLIGVPVFAVVYSVIKKFIAIKLQKKGLPSETAAYADDPSKL